MPGLAARHLTFLALTTNRESSESEEEAETEQDFACAEQLIQAPNRIKGCRVRKGGVLEIAYGAN